MFDAKEYPILVFAGNHREVEYYRRTHNFSPSQVRWISSPDKLQGIAQPPKTVNAALVGTFWERRDAHELKDVAYSRGIVLVRDWVPE